jgi:hypothetical protein
MSEPRTAVDPLLDELDEVRQRIWDECGRDEDTYVATLMEFQEQMRRDGWKFAPPADAEDEPVA